MQPNRILHAELARSLATLGHTDVVLVTDAGFPIPRDANIIDLGLTAGTVDVITILSTLRQFIFTEEVHFAPEVKTLFPPLYQQVQEVFTGSGAEFVAAPHEELIAIWAPKAKVVIRSGSLTAWANFALVASTDPFAWFRDDEGITEIIPAYISRRQRITDNVVPDLP